MIDRALDRLARAIEIVLALAFIVAVVLNFSNVVGRYLFGRSLLGSDEIQVFIMVAMTFLGAAVVTRRNEHLRMDVLLQFMPDTVRLGLRATEQILLIVLACFVLSQSYFYASQMLRIGRTSDMASVPMWIPHGAVALGFTLILLIALWRLVTTATGRRVEHSAPADGEVRE
jgi:TRAP-type C4-dicarboxylate transport system permease small subunit